MLALATKLAPERHLLEQAHRAGYRWVELWLGPAILAQLPTVIAASRDYPFTYALHFPNRVEDVAATLGPCVELYQALRSRCLVIHQPQFDRHATALVSLNEQAGHGPIAFAVENHKLTPKGLIEWAERNPGLALDVEHLWKYTLENASLSQLFGEIDQFLARFGEKLRHVHLPGYLPGGREHRPMYFSPEMVFGILDRLAEYRFQGLIVSESDQDHQNPEDLAIDVLLFERWRQVHAQRTHHST